MADAVEWIAAQEKSSPDKPWFAWVALNLAHATSQNQPSSMAVPNADLLDAASYNEMKACGGVFGSAESRFLRRQSVDAGHDQCSGYSGRQAVDSGRWP